MNTRGIIYGLVLIVVGLSAGLVYLLVRDPVLGPRSSQLPFTQTNLVTQVAVRKINSTNYFLLPSGFRWSSLESTNYYTYVQNLRAIGCPEETVRDIIVADVAKLFQQRRAEMVDYTRPLPFWKAPVVDADLQLALRNLEAEERKLIRDLLGVDLATELQKYSLDLPQRPMDLGFLDGEKQNRLKLALESHAAQEAAMRERSLGLWTEEDDGMLRELHHRQELEIKGMLSPEEFTEYQLRFSPLSSQLRQQLQGFDGNEEEFRKIFRLRKGYEDALYELSANAGSGSDKVLDFQNQAQALLSQELKNELGEKRFETYQKETDPSFQTLSKVQERFNLNSASVDQAYNALKVAESHTQQLLNNNDIELERRDEALQAIERETDAELRRLIGADAARVLRSALGR